MVASHGISIFRRLMSMLFEVRTQTPLHGEASHLKVNCVIGKLRNYHFHFPQSRVINDRSLSSFIVGAGVIAI